jgi:hypothetical protein
LVVTDGIFRKEISHKPFMALFMISPNKPPTATPVARCTSLLSFNFGLNLHKDPLKKIVQYTLLSDEFFHSVYASWINTVNIFRIIRARRRV